MVSGEGGKRWYVSGPPKGPRNSGVFGALTCMLSPVF